jgi:uncharacterized protein YbjT (DUF2867 family)
MSDPVHLLLLGATGMVGRLVLEEAVGRAGLRLTAIARREIPLPCGARMELRLAPVADWPELIAGLRPDAVICALGTTMAAANGDEDAFRAVDQALVLEVARAARAAGVGQFVTVSSVGADLAAKAFYLRVKGETERDLGKMGFRRLDILQPGLLRGVREGRVRVLERLAGVIAPLMNLFLQGRLRRYRAIDARLVARAALALLHERAGGRFTHEYDAMRASCEKVRTGFSLETMRQ